MSPGLMSAGLGSVPAEQTYLDVGQGNRVFDSLYDAELPAGSRVPLLDRDRSRKRAESAPAEIVPGLLTSALRADGMATSPSRGRARALSVALRAAALARSTPALSTSATGR